MHPTAQRKLGDCVMTQKLNHANESQVRLKVSYIEFGVLVSEVKHLLDRGLKKIRSYYYEGN